MVLRLILASKLSELEQFENFWDPTFFWLTLYVHYDLLGCFRSQKYVFLFRYLNIIYPKIFQDIKSELVQFEEAGTLRGKLTAAAQAEMISGTDSLETCVQGAKYIQVDVSTGCLKKNGI